MCGLRLTQLSFSFRDSSAVFSDLSFFTFFTTGDIKQSSSTLFTFSKSPGFISFPNSLLTSSCRCSGMSLHFFVFVLPDTVPVSTVWLSRCLLLFRCSHTCPRSCLKLSQFRIGCCREINFFQFFILNLFIKINNGVISVLSVIKISIFCLLFSYCMFTGIFPQSIIPFFLFF